MRDDRLGLLLEVVGRQGVVLGAHERLEEPPRPAGREAERAASVSESGSPGRRAGGRLTHRAIEGAATHRATNGAATSAAAGSAASDERSGDGREPTPPAIRR